MALVVDSMEKGMARVVKLPTLLEGEDYQKVTNASKRAFHPTKVHFSVLKQFKKKATASGSLLACSCTV